MSADEIKIKPNQQKTELLKMRTFIVTAAALAATGASAHDGLHMHPHGAETFLGFAFMAAIIAAVTYAIGRSRP